MLCWISDLFRFDEDCIFFFHIVPHRLLSCLSHYFCFLFIPSKQWWSFSVGVKSLLGLLLFSSPHLHMTKLYLQKVPLI